MKTRLLLVSILAASVVALACCFGMISELAHDNLFGASEFAIVTLVSMAFLHHTEKYL